MAREGSQGKLERFEIFYPDVEEEIDDLLEAADSHEFLVIEL